MALVITFTPGESFDETGDTITLEKLNRVINSGYGVISSGSIDTDNIGDLQVTAAKLHGTLDLTGKAVTLPVGIDLSKGVATGLDIEAMGTPTHLGQIGVLTGGKVFVSKGITSTADWVYGGYFNITGIDEAAFGTPDLIGQWAIDSAGRTYRAVALTGDPEKMWMPLRSSSLDLVSRDDDPDHLDFNGLTGSGHIRLYNKSNNLFMLQDDGTVVQVQATGQGDVYIAQNRQDRGVFGQLMVKEVWTKVELNTEITTGSTIASLTDSRVRLDPGNYEFDYFIQFEYDAGDTPLGGRLYDATAGAFIANSGSRGLNATVATDGADVIGVGFFTITVQSDIELQGWVDQSNCSIGEATWGADDAGISELFASLRFRRHL